MPNHKVTQLLRELHAGRLSYFSLLPPDVLQQMMPMYFDLSTWPVRESLVFNGQLDWNYESKTILLLRSGEIILYNNCGAAASKRIAGAAVNDYYDFYNIAAACLGNSEPFFYELIEHPLVGFYILIQYLEQDCPEFLHCIDGQIVGRVNSELTSVDKCCVYENTLYYVGQTKDDDVVVHQIGYGRICDLDYEITYGYGLRHFMIFKHHIMLEFTCNDSQNRKYLFDMTGKFIESSINVNHWNYCDRYDCIGVSVSQNIELYVDTTRIWAKPIGYGFPNIEYVNGRLAVMLDMDDHYEMWLVE